MVGNAVVGSGVRSDSTVAASQATVACVAVPHEALAMGMLEYQAVSWVMPSFKNPRARSCARFVGTYYVEL